MAVVVGDLHPFSGISYHLAKGIGRLGNKLMTVHICVGLVGHPLFGARWRWRKRPTVRAASGGGELAL